MFGHSDFTSRDFDKIHDYYFANYYQTGTIKPPMTKEMYDKAELGYCISFFQNWMVEDVRKLCTQNITLKVLDFFKKKMQDPKNNPLTYYGMSAHDSNIAPFIMAVNILSVDCYLKELETGEKQPNCQHSIPYASNIIWELSSVKSDPNDDSKVDYLIRMLYNGKLMLDCNKYLTNSAKITYEGYCTFDQFEEVSKKLFILGDAE